MKASPDFRRFCEKYYPMLHERASGIVKTGEEHVPLLLAFPNEEAPAIPLVMTFAESKEQITAIHRNISAAMPTCLIQESWYITAPTEELAYDAFRGNRSLAEHPDRKEALIFNFMQGEMQLLAMCKIDRDTGSLERAELTDPFETGTTGRMVLNTREERLQ